MLQLVLSGRPWRPTLETRRPLYTVPRLGGQRRRSQPRCCPSCLVRPLAYIVAHDAVVSREACSGGLRGVAAVPWRRTSAWWIGAGRQRIAGVAGEIVGGCRRRPTSSRRPRLYTASRVRAQLPGKRRCRRTFLPSMCGRTWAAGRLCSSLGSCGRTQPTRGSGRESHNPHGHSHMCPPRLKPSSQVCRRGPDFMCDCGLHVDVDIVSPPFSLLR